MGGKGSGKHKEEPIQYQLPTGIRIGEKPQDIEILSKTRSKWLAVVKTLEQLASTSTVQIDILGLDKKKVACIRTGIRSTINKLNLNTELVTAEKGNTLHLWLRKRV